MNGKGSRSRVRDGHAWEEGYDRIFGGGRRRSEQVVEAKDHRTLNVEGEGRPGALVEGEGTVRLAVEAKAAEEVIEYAKDGKWPERSDDPRWAALKGPGLYDGPMPPPRPPLEGRERLTFEEFFGEEFPEEGEGRDQLVDGEGSVAGGVEGEGYHQQRVGEGPDRHVEGEGYQPVEGEGTPGEKEVDAWRTWFASGATSAWNHVDDIEATLRGEGEGARRRCVEGEGRTSHVGEGMEGEGSSPESWRWWRG